MNEDAPKPHTEEEVAFWESRIASAETIGDVEGTLIYRGILARRALICIALEEEL